MLYESWKTALDETLEEKYLENVTLVEEVTLRME